MLVLNLLFLCGVFPFVDQFVYGADKCITFKTNTRLVSAEKDFNAVLTLSVVNKCKGSDTAIQSIRVARDSGGSSLDIFCRIEFHDGALTSLSGCTHDVSSDSFSVTHHAREGDIWTLIARLRNGARVVKTVKLSATSELSSLVWTVVVPVTGGSLALIAVISVAVVRYKRKKHRLAAQDQPNEPVPSQGAANFPNPQSPDGGVIPFNPENAELQPLQSNTQEDEDEDGYTLPNLSSLPAQSYREASTSQCEGNRGLASDISQASHEQSCDEDDYTLPDLTTPNDDKSAAVKSLYENTDFGTDVSNPCSALSYREESTQQCKDSHIFVSGTRLQQPQSHMPSCDESDYTLPGLEDDENASGESVYENTASVAIDNSNDCASFSVRSSGDYDDLREITNDSGKAQSRQTIGSPFSHFIAL